MQICSIVQGQISGSAVVARVGRSRPWSLPARPTVRQSIIIITIINMIPIIIIDIIVLIVTIIITMIIIILFWRTLAWC